MSPRLEYKKWSTYAMIITFITFITFIQSLIEFSEFQFTESRSPEFRLVSQFSKPFGRDRERSLLLPWFKTSVSWW
jgi:hypothetical protein